ncbi:hypothetical protein CIN_13510 [Commensalibacter intestini A911]|uniref:Uncharacterized protein n=2 Tax=Commensalibacter intestini TaxID=479936 RepID=A0A251ZTD6_9PROT|nr:hypothetical protein [Commensalibacter intestini]EHD13992.1 hypothetical protein CIN_13510 [Commensalibacter intestini A911]OUI77938.1 hypothetical protein HK18_00890 [Commensalibacter intestini]
MGVLIEKPSCSPPPLSAFEAKDRPNAAEMERRRKEFSIRVITGLGTDIDRYASQSPTLVKQISKLKRKDWKIVWGADGGGTTTQFEYYDVQDNRIIIDSHFKTNQSQDIAYVTSSLAHEVGHAFFHKVPDLSSIDACIKSLMFGGGSEADAIINQLTVRKEILNAVCIDIFEEYNEYAWMKKDFVDIYNLGVNMKDMKTAKDTIAKRYSKQYTSNTKQTYEDYYCDYCKRNICKQDTSKKDVSKKDIP